MTRREFSRTTKLAAWDRSQGKCEAPECGLKIFPGDGPEYDHRIPCDHGGDASLDNCVVLCIPCHRKKTDKVDAPAIAKSRSVRAGHVNAKTRKAIIPGSRKSPFKKRLDGTVVRRDA